MMKIFQSKFIHPFLSLVFFLGVMNFANAADAAPKCVKEKAEFRKLYFSLQEKYNYAGTDEYLDDKGKLKTRKHDPAKDYPGKVFENALYLEYQKTLAKVGKVFQDARFGKDPNNFKSNPTLVAFMAAIENKDVNSTAYIDNNDINKVINELAKSSNGTINENDKYLLQKLLTHAQDRLCSIEEYGKTKKDTKFFSAKELKQITNAPLNQLVNLLKNVKENSDIKLVDTDTTIFSAITENLSKLRKWMVDNKACLKALRNPGFLQANIQPCNYNKFLDALSSENYNSLETILHYINANERLLNRPAALADTALDENKLEYHIDQTFRTISDRVNCILIDSADKKSQRIFVHGLPYDTKTEKYDTAQIECEIKGKKLPSDQCQKQFQLVSDDKGRGMEIQALKASKNPIIFSVKGGIDCRSLTDDGPQTPEEPGMQQVIINGRRETPIPQKERPFLDLKLDDLKPAPAVDCVKDPTNLLCSLPDIKPTDDEQAKCLARKEEGFTFSWDPKKDPKCVKTAVAKNCDKENAEANKKDDTEGFGTPVARFILDEKTGKCVDKQKKKSKGKADVEQPEPAELPDVPRPVDPVIPTPPQNPTYLLQGTR